MLLSSGVRHVVPVAHPVTDHPHLDVPVALVAAAAFLVVVGVGLVLPQPRSRTGGGVAAAPEVPSSWHGRLGPGRTTVRGLALAVLGVAVLAARTGSENELENLAPALLVGVGWPAVFLATLVVGSAWRWVDPWDTLGRLAVPGDRSTPGDDVRPAVVVALGLVWYLAVPPRPFEPRTVGAVVTAYAVLMVAGCLVRGRRRWLSTAEPLGVVLDQVARARRARPATPDEVTAVRGLHALLGVVAGGTLFAAIRRTELWTDLTGSGDALSVGTAGLLAASALGGALVALQAWATRSLAGTRGATTGRAVALSVAPAVAGMVVAVGLARNRLTNSLQLLPGLVGDPFGRGWDLLGEPTAGLDPAPLGAAGLLVAQLTVLLLAHLWGAVVAARLLPRGQRSALVLLQGQLVAAGVAAVSLH